MALTLTIISYHQTSLEQATAKTLNQGRLTLGRAPDNDWVLPDPEMILSKSHCCIERRDDGYYITDTSTNGVFINHSEQRLGRGNSVKLNAQDVISLGDYEINVSLGDAPGVPAMQSPGPTPVAEPDFLDMGEPEPQWGRQQAGAAADFDADFNEIAPPDSMADDEDPLGLDADAQDQAEPSWGQYSEPDHLPSDREYFQPPKAIPDASMPPPQSVSEQAVQGSPVDELGLDSGSDAEAAPASSQAAIPDDWEDSLIQRLIKEDDIQPVDDLPDDFAGIDEPLLPTAPPDTPQNTPWQPPAEVFPEAKEEEGPAESELDSFVDLNEDSGYEEDTDEEPESATFTEQIPVFADPEPAAAPPLKPAPAAPVVATPPPQTTAPPVSPATPAAAELPVNAPNVAAGNTQAASYALAAQTFLQGASMPAVALTEPDAQKLLHSMGQVFRQTAQGMMELLRARGNIKSEFHIERTMVGPMQNNPLKILPTVDDAMHAMLLRRDKTWIPADRAIDEGFDDLRAHELAVMAGMQAALTHLLAAFDPARLEQELGQNSTWSNLLAGGRKARHWDAFTALYSKIAAKAEDDFQELFRKEFSRAYQIQLQKLSRDRES